MGESKAILNKIAFLFCNFVINKLMISLTHLDYKTKYRYFIKAKKNYYENFKFYKFLYNRKENKKDAIYDCNKSDIEFYFIQYKKFKKKYEKEYRKIKKEERFKFSF